MSVSSDFRNDRFFRNDSMTVKIRFPQRAEAARDSALAVELSVLALRLPGASSLLMSSRTTNRPLTFPSPVTQFNPPPS